MLEHNGALRLPHAYVFVSSRFLTSDLVVVCSGRRFLPFGRFRATPAEIAETRGANLSLLAPDWTRKLNLS